MRQPVPGRAWPRVRAIVALVVASVVLFACMWCVVPGLPFPAMVVAILTVIAAVSAPEYAPVLACVALVAGALAIWCAPPRRVRRIVAALATLAFACAAAPIVAYLADPSLPKVVSLATMVHSTVPRHASQRAPRQTYGITLGDGTRIPVDIYNAPGYRAPNPGLAPAMIEIHGGAWMFGTTETDADHFPRIADEGITVIAIDYRHAPRHTFPAQLDDVNAAIANVAANAKQMFIDPKRMVLVGRSAGAQLALLAAYEPQPIPFRGVAGFYAPTDLVTGALHAPPIDPLDIRRALTAYMGPYASNRGRYADASPVRVAAHRRVAPTFLMAGDRDELVDISQQRSLAAVLRATPGNDVEAYELPWSNHAFDDVQNGMGEQIADALLDRWLHARLGADFARIPASTGSTPKARRLR